MDTQIPSSAAEVRTRLEALGHADMQELARQSNVPFTTLWKIRSGETENPRIETVGQFFRLIETVRAAAAERAA